MSEREKLEEENGELSGANFQRSALRSISTVHMSRQASEIDALEALVTSQHVLGGRSPVIIGSRCGFREQPPRSFAAKTTSHALQPRSNGVSGAKKCGTKWPSTSQRKCARHCVETCRACNERIRAGSGPDWSHFLGTAVTAGFRWLQISCHARGGGSRQSFALLRAPIRSLVASPSCSRCPNVKMTPRLVELSIALLRDTPRVNAIASVGFYT
jgi:hypothetical protein